MKKVTKFSSLILAFVMVFSLVCMIAPSADAATNPNTVVQTAIDRATSLASVKWTCLKTFKAWFSSSSSGTQGTYVKGQKYIGVPYAQGRKYVGYDVTLSDFISAVNNPNSVFYTNSYNSGILGPYYGSDCSGLVSYAWGISRNNTYSLVNNAGNGKWHSVVSPKKLTQTDLNKVHPGDAFVYNNGSGGHAIFVSEVYRNSAGNVIRVVTIEETGFHYLAQYNSSTSSANHYNKLMEGNTNLYNTYMPAGAVRRDYNTSNGGINYLLNTLFANSNKKYGIFRLNAADNAAISTRINVTLKGNGGTPAEKTITVTNGCAYGILITPSRKGYTFLGWYTQKTGGTLVTSSSIVTSQTNQILWAHWIDSNIEPLSPMPIDEIHK